MHIRLIFIFLVLFNLTSGVSIGQDINCFEDPLDFQLKNRFSQKCSYQILSKNSSMYCFRDSLGIYHVIGLYFLEGGFYKKDERFKNFISQLNAGYDTIVIDSMKVIISGLEYFQVDGDSKSKGHRTPIYYLNPGYFAEGLNYVYFFNIDSYQFLASAAGIKKVNECLLAYLRSSHLYDIEDIRSLSNNRFPNFLRLNFQQNSLR